MPAEKILIVDDERLVRWSLRQKCEEWGFQVIEAAAGEPALRLSETENPDLVLLDVRLPDLSGIEVLDQLRKNPETSPAVIISAEAVTVRSSPPTRSYRCSRSGSDFLPRRSQRSCRRLGRTQCQPCQAFRLAERRALRFAAF